MSHMDHQLRKIAVIGNYVPRRCGIATFTADLVESVAAVAPETALWAVVMNDVPGGYPYPPRVRFELDDAKLADYRLAAEFLNMNRVEIACLQHEYGIFGGVAGRHILRLIGELRMPVVTTLHTVLKEPSPEQMQTLREIARLSDRLVVMSQRAGGFLHEIYEVPEEKIAFIHHGIPDVPFVDPNYYKDQFGVEGRKVILTFGLLSKDKGVEHLIRALPRIIREHPDVIYIVLGVTHPTVKRHEGESYRLWLQQLARNLDVAHHVAFQNRFVDVQELIEFLGAADVYVTPYVKEAQIVSGTLAYAMGTGKAIVSTPYWYAEEMLAEQRGRLVPFGHPEALAAEIISLFDNPTERHAMRKRAYLFTRDAVWKEVALSYLRLFTEARENRLAQTSRSFAFVQREPLDLPEIHLEHLCRLTDDTGILQHAQFSVPDVRHGYTTDDNARALLLCALAEELLPLDPTLSQLGSRYLSFLNFAFNEETGRFRNFMSYDRRWLEEQGSEDSHARALWALGSMVNRTADKGHLALATVLFSRAVPAAERLIHLRARAFALIGINAYLRRYSGDSEAKRIKEFLADRLEEQFRHHSGPNWPWPEPRLTYDNARLPHALIVAGESLGRDDMLETGLKALAWLISIQTEDGCLVPVGNRGWYERGGVRARFDQQPVEVYSLLDACIAAYTVSAEERWVEEANRCFSWFLGQNALSVSLCDLRTGACCDGLEADGPNMNQGAESTLAWLLSLVQMHLLRAERSLPRLSPREIEVTGPREQES